MTFYTKQAARPYHGRAASLVNRHCMQRKNRVTKVRDEPRTASSQCVGDMLIIAPPDFPEKRELHKRGLQ